MKSTGAVSLKQRVGEEAANRVESGQIVGLGTGSTAAWSIKHLGKRMQEGSLQDIRGVCTSFQSELLAKQAGIPLIGLDDVERIDVAIDGADQVDPQMNLIKGGGAAHTREKVVDSLADSFIVVVDGSKMVPVLGDGFPVPVEVLPMALGPVTRALKRMGAKPELRMGVKKDGPVITDQGLFVVDADFGPIADPAALEKSLNNLPGVLENGLFVALAHCILIGEVVDGEEIVRSLA